MLSRIFNLLKGGDNVKMSKIYERPILLSKRQISMIRSGKMVSIRRNKMVLTLGKKGSTTRLAKLKAKKSALEAQIASLRRSK